MKAVILLVFVRLFSVFFVKTSFAPDEYWQSLEVAHKFAFDYGYLTWEWIKGIRSYVYPLFIALFYKIVKNFGFDTAPVIILGPRIIQALFTAYADYSLYKWTGKKKWCLFNVITSWFWFYIGSRTLINTFETCITAIALSKFPWNGRTKGNKFLFLVAMLCAIRPTGLIQWIPLCLYHIWFSKENTAKVIWKQYIPIGLLVLLLTLLVDCFMHGSFVLTSFEFLKLNVINDFASFYGVHPWYWYLSSGLPSLLGIHIVPFIFATVDILKNRYVYPNELFLLACIVFTVGVYSLLPHKEFRFVSSLLPIFFYINSKYLSRWSRKRNNFVIWLTAGTILVGNLIPAYYFSRVHQRGTLQVMDSLREIAEKHPDSVQILFLMPCHSTPLYSHLHVNVPTEILTCEPNFEGLDDYVDETKKFYDNPNKWLREKYPSNGTLPSHIVIFDVLEPFLTDILSRYKPIEKIFHTDIPIESKIGKNVIIYELYS